MTGSKFWMEGATVYERTEGVRKYDIEAEAYKLYKDNLKEVIQRFRRTSQYLEILEEKVEEFKSLVTSITLASMKHFDSRLRNKVAEYYYTKIFIEPELEKEKIALKTNASKASKIKRRNDDFYNIPMLNSRRQNEEAPTYIELLDNYKHLKTQITVTQKNELTNMGFEYAGYAIHAIISGVSDDDAKVMKSTRQPAENEFQTTHVSVHKVTTNVEMEATEPMTHDDKKYPKEVVKKYKNLGEESTKGPFLKK